MAKAIVATLEDLDSILKPIWSEKKSSPFKLISVLPGTPQLKHVKTHTYIDLINAKNLRETMCIQFFKNLLSYDNKKMNNPTENGQKVSY